MEIQQDGHIKHLVHSQHQDLNVYDVTINPTNEGDFSRQDVALAVSLNTQGIPVTQIMEKGESTQVILKAEANHPNPQNSLENCYVFSTNKKVPALMLHEIASIEKVKSSQYALHENGKSIGRAFLYSTDETDGKTALNTANGHISKLRDKYPDLAIHARGQEHATDEATQAIIDVLPWVLFLLMSLLLLKEWSIKRVFIIISVLPFAFAGASIGLLICGQSQGFISLIGLVSLLGIVVNNAILWLDALNNQTTSTNNYILATQERFRAITVTSLSCIATLVPLYCFGGDIWKPLAATLIFGLIFSYVAIVIILPIIASTLSVQKNTHVS